MSYMRVCCAVIRQGDKYLMVQRPEKKAEPLKWEFPGGKVEPGESDAACIRREIFEELGVSLHLHGRLRVSLLQSERRSIVLMGFLATLNQGTIRLHEHIAQRWIAAADMFQLDISPADREIVGLLQEYGLEELRWWR